MKRTMLLLMALMFFGCGQRYQPPPPKTPEQQAEAEKADKEKKAKTSNEAVNIFLYNEQCEWAAIRAVEGYREKPTPEGKQAIEKVLQVAIEQGEFDALRRLHRNWDEITGWGVKPTDEQRAFALKYYEDYDIHDAVVLLRMVGATEKLQELYDKALDERKLRSVIAIGLYAETSAGGRREKLLAFAKERADQKRVEDAAELFTIARDLNAVKELLAKEEASTKRKSRIDRFKSLIKAMEFGRDKQPKKDPV